ncbi:MAG: Fic family protein, partial [Bacteroidetes bacterium]|nr:Fic family protein [Bacteroidota bacterium]
MHPKNNKSRIGEKITISYVQERVEAYLPPSLPPNPPINMKTLRSKLEKAYLTIGRLDGISEILPDISVFLYSYVRQEALLSSQIEGTQSSLSDLFLFEIDQPPSVPMDEIEEVSNCVSAMNHGVTRLNEGFPLSQRLMCEMHGILLSGGRGRTKL